jgi:perosamine synthetase
MNLKIHFGRPMYGNEEQKAAAFILKKRKLTCAGQVKAFEEQFEQFVGGGQAVAVSSCMAALHLSYLVKGIGRGDEVIVPALTHVATVHAVELVGATPRFVDCHPESGNLDPDLIEAAITERTKAISLVHFLGQPGYMRSTVAIARKHNLYIVEDCALALGSRHGLTDKHVGLIGDVGCFSFYPVKHITTGEGGMFLTTNAELAEKAKQARSFGITEDKSDVLSLGLNYRMTELQGIIGQEQLNKLPRFLNIRRRNAELLRGILQQRGYKVIGDSYALSVFVDVETDRDEVRHRLLQERIETSVYYARPVCDFTYYQKKYPQRWDVPHARTICEKTIALPVGPHLTTDDIRWMADQFCKAVEKQ